MENKEISEQEKPLQRLSGKINELCFECKDLFCNYDEFEILCSRKNLVTKIHTTKMGGKRPFVFFTASSFLDSNRMTEVVVACLRLAGKTAKTNIVLQEEFIRSFCETIQYKNSIDVLLTESSISILNNDISFMVFDVQDIDAPAKHMLLRSFCMLLAFCGKTVRNNQDKVVLNDYGIANVNSFTDGGIA